MDTTTNGGTRPTIVFVHGAWADAAGFDGEIRALHRQGYRTLGAANPLRHLESDAAYVAQQLRTVEGPIVLVGHSYGGAVITNAATGNDQVKALVYLNGWVPDEGESVKQLFEMNENPDLPPALRPHPITNPDGSEGVDFYIDQEAFLTAFAGDVDRETARVMAATQRPSPAQRSKRRPARPPGSRFRRGTCLAARTRRSRRRPSGSWPSAQRRRSRRCRPPTRRWCRSRTRRRS